jgi:hypothetical protein
MDIISQFSDAHLRQKSFKRATPSHGCNGVLPVSSHHPSLCKTLDLLGACAQIVQIGHWCQCPAVYSDALAIGNPWFPSYLDTARLVCTILEPGSHELVQVCARPHASLMSCSSERHRLRTDLVWFQVAVEASWTPLPSGRDVFTWPVTDVLVKQVPCVPGKVAWHLVFDTVVFRGPRLPSEYFSWRDRDYWANCVDDIHSPANRAELKQGFQDVCARCTRALDGVASQVPKRLKLVFKTRPIEAVLSLDEFF